MDLGEKIIIFLIGVLVGTILTTISWVSKIILTDSTPPYELEKIEKCSCGGLTTDQVKMIIGREFVNAFQLNWAIDGAVKDPEFKPFLKSILKDINP